MPWSHNAAEINAGIDQMLADGRTSISDGLDAARQLFARHGRVGATKIVLLVSDGAQTVDAAPFKRRRSRRPSTRRRLLRETAPLCSRGASKQT